MALRIIVSGIHKLVLKTILSVFSNVKYMYNFSCRGVSGYLKKKKGNDPIFSMTHILQKIGVLCMLFEKSSQVFFFFFFDPSKP